MLGTATSAVLGRQSRSVRPWRRGERSSSRLPSVRFYFRPIAKRTFLLSSSSFFFLLSFLILFFSSSLLVFFFFLLSSSSPSSFVLSSFFFSSSFLFCLLVPCRNHEAPIAVDDDDMPPANIGRNAPTPDTAGSFPCRRYNRPCGSPVRADFAVTKTRTKLLIQKPCCFAYFARRQSCARMTAGEVIVEKSSSTPSRSVRANGRSNVFFRYRTRHWRRSKTLRPARALTNFRIRRSVLGWTAYSVR